METVKFLTMLLSKLAKFTLQPDNAPFTLKANDLFALQNKITDV
jgi:hypothetical protein